MVDTKGFMKFWIILTIIIFINLLIWPIENGWSFATNSEYYVFVDAKTLLAFLVISLFVPIWYLFSHKN
jgi:hypothetical protein